MEVDLLWHIDKKNNLKKVKVSKGAKDNNANEFLEKCTWFVPILRTCFNILFWVNS